MAENLLTIHPDLDEMMRVRFGGCVTISRREPIAGDASSLRSYVRLWLDGQDAPATAVAMVMQGLEAAKTSEEGGEEVESDEIPFVNVYHFLVANEVSVPEIYVDAAEDGVLILEDVGDVALWDAVENAPANETRRLFGLAIEQLLRIQIDGTASRDEACIGFSRQFDEDLYMWELEHFLEWGFSGIDGPPAAAELRELRRCFAKLAADLGNQPRVLNHRDYHAWNLYLHDGRIRVIDFQDLLLAAAPYDLATLLGDRITPSAIDAELERALVADYGNAWAQHPAAPWRFDDEELWRVYRDCALQKAFKVVGRFHYLDRVKQKSSHLRFIPPTLERIQTLLTERDDPEMRVVHEILQPYFAELRA